MTSPAAIQQQQMRGTPGGLVLPLPSPLLASLPARYQDRPMQWFIQPITLSNIASAATSQGSFQVDSNHAFACWFGSLKLRSPDDATNRDGDCVLVSMQDNQNNLYNPSGSPAIDVETLFGSAKQPTIWPEPLIIAPNGTFTLSATVKGPNALNLRFAFPGVLITVGGR